MHAAPRRLLLVLLSSVFIIGRPRPKLGNAGLEGAVVPCKVARCQQDDVARINCLEAIYPHSKDEHKVTILDELLYAYRRWNPQTALLVAIAKRRFELLPDMLSLYFLGWALEQHEGTPCTEITGVYTQMMDTFIDLSPEDQAFGAVETKPGTVTLMRSFAALAAEKILYYAGHCCIWATLNGYERSIAQAMEKLLEPSPLAGNTELTCMDVHSWSPGTLLGIEHRFNDSVRHRLGVQYGKTQVQKQGAQALRKSKAQMTRQGAAARAASKVIRKEAATAGTTEAATATTTEAATTTGKLNIGFLSADFIEHPMFYATYRY
jgi:hypothetical protein